MAGLFVRCAVAKVATDHCLVATDLAIAAVFAV